MIDTEFWPASPLAVQYKMQSTELKVDSIDHTLGARGFFSWRNYNRERRIVANEEKKTFATIVRHLDHGFGADRNRGFARKHTITKLAK